MVDALDRNMGVHMNFQFPASPTEGQIYAPAGGPQYVYRAPYWRASGRVDTIVAETPPAGPKNGQLWFNSSTGNTYIWYEDPNSAQWVQINVGPDASSSVLTPERFGADPTGVASSDAAFDALAAHVNSIGGNCTIEMAGRYKLVATHTFTVGNVLVDGRGTGLIDVSASTDTSDLMPIMHFTGPGLVAAPTLLSGTVAKGARTITVADGSTFSPGSRGYITSTGEYFYGVGTTSGFHAANKGELIVVQAIAGNVLTLEVATRDSYDGVTYPTYVRRVDTIPNITVRDLRLLGPGVMSVYDGAAGPVGLVFSHVAGLHMDNLDIENFQSNGMTSVMGWDHTAINLKVRGRKLDDPGNTPPPATQYFYGWGILGTSNATAVAPTGDWVRRIVDPSESPLNMFDPADLQCVPARDIKVLGGHSKHCFTGPGGHNFDGFDVIGHTVEDAIGVGMNFRGRNIRVIGGRVNCPNITIGVGLGFGSDTFIDPSLYAENPTCEHVVIRDCPITVSLTDTGTAGVYATSALDSLVLDTRIEGFCAVKLTGKRADNLDIVPNWKGNGLGTLFWARNWNGKTSLSNWRIHNGHMSNCNRAIDIDGSANTRDIDIFGNTLSAVTTYVRFQGGGGTPVWGPNIRVRNNVSDRTATNPIINANLLGVNFVEVANDWDSFQQTFTIAAGIITVPAAPGIMRIKVDTEAAAATDDLTQINGGSLGQIIALSTTSSARDVVLVNSALLVCPGAVNLSLLSAATVVLLIKTSAANWLVL